MEKNTGYQISLENIDVLIHLTGRERRVLEANIGWVAIYQEDPFPRWSLLPKKVAESVKDFYYVDNPLNGLPTRSEKEIRKELSELNSMYSDKLTELYKELERRKLLDNSSQEKHPL